MVKSNEDRNLFMGHKSEEDEHELSQINQSQRPDLGQSLFMKYVKKKATQ